MQVIGVRWPYKPCILWRTMLDSPHRFNAKLEIVVGNPFVFVPTDILQDIFRQANRQKGPIPVCGTINGKPFQQTLMRYSGDWRLYINMQMLDNSPRRIGEILKVELEFDPSDRTLRTHPKLEEALAENEVARAVFDQLSPSRQKEIVRYINQLKNPASVDRNVTRAINFLLGKERFVGRDNPY